MNDEFYDDLMLSLSQALSIAKSENELNWIFIVKDNLNRLNKANKSVKHSQTNNIKSQKKHH